MTSTARCACSASARRRSSPPTTRGGSCPRRLREALGEGPTIVCAQAGEVNTGAFDPLPEIADACEAAGAWLHVDGAFGIWAAVSPRLRHLVAGLERADSWTTDAHKWLNVPYDSGIVLCRHPESHRAAMTIVASYLIQDEGAQRVRDQVDWVPEFSRRARGFAVYAALRSLGRSGLVELVERCCDGATRFAERDRELDGVEVLNEVVLNQVLFRFESDERTDEVLARVQESGRVWMSGTTWDGRKAIRVSVSNWQTGDEEIDLAVRRVRRLRGGPSRRPGRAGPRASGRRSPPARSRSRSARRGRRPSRRPRARAGRRDPRSRRCRSRAARTGSRRGRRPTRRARSRPPRARRARSRSPCCACCGRGSRPRPCARPATRTSRGAATPIVSARTTSARSKRPASSATRPGSTRPSNGQPKATLIVTVAGTWRRGEDLVDARDRLVERGVAVAAG